jgi:hypothetical protein
MIHEARIPSFKDICGTAAAVRCLKGGQKVTDIAKSAGKSPSSLRRQVSKAGFKKKYGQWRHTSESVVAALLEDGEQVRVCAACEQEFGPVPVPPGAIKSHGMCRRHTFEFYGDMARAKFADKPDDYFSPDLSRQQGNAA